MARLTACCFALSAVLIVLATGIGSGNGQLPVAIPTTDPAVTPPCLEFPGGQFPPSLLESHKFLGTLLPMRIICKGDTSLSIASDDKGEVFLAPTNCRDAGQLWVQHYPNVGDRSQFSLVNVNPGSKDPLRAIQISDDRSYPVKLAPYNPALPVPSSMLWTQDAKVFGDGFHKIRSCNNTGLVLDALRGDEGLHNNTVVGAYPAPHDGDHVVWKTPPFVFKS